MNIAALLSRRRLILALTAIFTLVGLFSWAGMPRQEDPEMPNRWSQFVVVFPGADAKTVERLVVEPIEERLSEVEEIAHLNVTARANVAIGTVELNQDIYDVDTAWDKVRRALVLASRDIPETVQPPVLSTNTNDVESVLLALTGPSDPLLLLAAAKKIKGELLTLPQVSRVIISADPGEQITVELEEHLVNRAGVNAAGLAQRLGGRNTVLPGGSLQAGGRSVVLRPQTEFVSLQEIGATPITLESGASVPLQDLAQVTHTVRQPITEKMRHNLSTAVGIGVVPRRGIDVVGFGEVVREKLTELRAQMDPVQIEEIAFQPAFVERRLSNLSISLLLGILIVAAVLVLTMGPRLGLTVASVVPLVALSSLGVFAMSGGLLHQISIAALVISLGLLVDNAIVVAENIQRRLDRGQAGVAAITSAVRELALPLATATGTTLAAFVPILLARGITADFTRALPLVLMLTLTISYVFAVAVTPVLALLFLRRREKSGESGVERVAQRVASCTLGHSRLVIASALVLVMASVLAARGVQGQFFPASDRAMVLVDLELPEGAHLGETNRVALELERKLIDRGDVVAVTSLVGRGLPKFYYNIIGKPNRPHFAQMAVATVDTAAVEAVIVELRSYAGKHMPQASVVARQIEQGPPVVAPIEVRVYSQQLEDLYGAVQKIAQQLQTVPGAVDVRQSMGSGAPTLSWQIDDAVAARHGTSRHDVAVALLQQTQGVQIGQYRAGQDPIPIMMRSPQGENTSATELASLQVMGRSGSGVPLGQIARQSVEWLPAAIQHRDRARFATVTAQLAPGYSFGQVLQSLKPSLPLLDLPQVRLEYGGSAEGSGDANSSMLRAMPIGFILLLFFLLAEFNSFRRVLIILTTVPLAATGVVPGLLLGEQPFGFMSMLGVIALVGIVVNNAIVLLDLIDRLRHQGLALNRALVTAVGQRSRPILLTTATTVAGLIPLALSPSPLWPPLAFAMISGLLASTLLTLLVVPAMYLTLLPEKTGIALGTPEKTRGLLQVGLGASGSSTTGP